MTSSELLIIRPAKTIFKQDNILDFPGGPVVEKPPANAEDTGSIPGLGRFHMPQRN